MYTLRHAVPRSGGTGGRAARPAPEPGRGRCLPAGAPATARIVPFAYIGEGCSATTGTAGTRDSTLDGYAANVLDIRGEPARGRGSGRAASVATGVLRHPGRSSVAIRDELGER
ncbi:hypothetical protein KRMM14A1004_46730 [Krasilnikovia sp. MM14-A1004]